MNKLKPEVEVFLQRLFSTFPNGWPGRGLLVQRVVIATFLFCFGFSDFRKAQPFASIFPQVIAAGAAIFLLLGLWTPICGTVVTVVEVWIAIARADTYGNSILLATLGATLAMIGPGAWSIDARLFGRKHFEIPHG